MVKVVHIITLLELGGAQQNTLYTLSNLKKDKFCGYLICGKGGILDKEALNNPSFKTYFVPELVREINLFKDLVAFFKIYFILREIKPDVVHTHSSKAGILGRWAAKFAGVKKIIHTYHGFGFNDFQKLPIRAAFIFAERITASITDKLVAVSQENVEKGLINRIGKKQQYKVIHSGVKLKDFLNANVDISAKKREFGLKEEKVVGMVACFKPQKDPLSFVELAKLVSEKLENVKFILVGDGELRGAIEKKIKENNLEDKIILSGWREDIVEIMQIFDILVLTSLWEGLPRVFPEALASGKPIVATEVDGAKEIIKDGINGYLVKVKSPAQMAEKVCYLLEDDNLRKQMGEKGREIVYPDYDIDEMVKKIEELYEENNC